MDDAITTIVAFVEGRIDPVEFATRLGADPTLEHVLDDDPTLKPGTYVGNSTYLFIIEEDISTPGGALNIHGALSQFLGRKGIPFRPTPAFSERYNLILKAQPRWLDVDAAWLEKEVLPAANGRKGNDLREWLRARLLELFTYNDKPPRWLQSPNWPIGPNGPLVFLGQLKISGYFHDDAIAYLFHDPKSGTYETVIQVC